MAKGDSEFKGASGAIYAMNFGTNAACRVEAALDRSYDDIMAELSGRSPRVMTIREWVKAALVSPAPTDVTLEQVGDLIDDLGGWTFILVGLQSQSPTALATSQAIKDALSVVAALKSAEPEVLAEAVETVTH